jgi:hypothetical protein
LIWFEANGTTGAVEQPAKNAAVITRANTAISPNFFLFAILFLLYAVCMAANSTIYS